MDYHAAKFLTPLDLRAYDPGEWVLLSMLEYQSAGGERYYVPPTFITDLASIPAIVRPAIDQNGKSRRSAVLHDYLYCRKHGSRKDADDLFLEALEAEGVNMIVRRVMWLAARAWGWRYWNKRSGITSEDFADD